MNYLNLQLPLTPKGALDDFKWLRENHYWWHFSLNEFCAQYWAPMTERELVSRLSTRMRFNRGSKPYKLAHALREARLYHEKKDGGKSLRGDSEPSQGPTEEEMTVRLIQQDMEALVRNLQTLNAKVEGTVMLQDIVMDAWELNERMRNHLGGI